MPETARDQVLSRRFRHLPIARAMGRGILAIVVLVLLAGCGDSAERERTSDGGAMTVAGSRARLATLLKENGVHVGNDQTQSAHSLAAAWVAFKTFATERVAEGELSAESLNDGLLFEYGVFDFGKPWGSTFELNFVRQYATPGGDLQQVHLVAHFPAAVLDEIRTERDVPANSAVWSFDTGGSGWDSQRRSWIDFVEASPVFETVKSRKPLGYELWQDSAE